MSDKPDTWVPYAQPLLDAVALFEELGIAYALVGGITAARASPRISISSPLLGTWMFSPLIPLR